MHKCASSLKWDSHKTVCLMFWHSCLALELVLMHRGQWPYWQIFVLDKSRVILIVESVRLVLDPTNWLVVETADVHEVMTYKIKKTQEIISLEFVMSELKRLGMQGIEHCTCMHSLDFVCKVSTWPVYILHLANNVMDFSEILCVKFKFLHWELLGTFISFPTFAS
jgi:hypothetical protein